METDPNTVLLLVSEAEYHEDTVFALTMMLAVSRKPTTLRALNIIPCFECLQAGGNRDREGICFGMALQKGGIATWVGDWENITVPEDHDEVCP